MGDKEKKILGGLALAALVATGAGAAGVGPLASILGGAGEAGVGAGTAAAGTNMAELMAGTAGEGAALGAETGAGLSAGNEAALLANVTGEGALPYGGAAGAEPAAGAIGEGAGAPLGSQAAKAPVDFSKFLTKAGDQATNAAISASIGQAMQPNVRSTVYGQPGFQPYQPVQPTGMRMTSPEEQLRRLGFS